jgi:hypothetical protein
MFRFVIAVLATIGLASLLFGGAVGVGWLLAPFIIGLKILFFVMIFGMIGSACRRNRRYSARGPWGWRPAPERNVDERPSPREQFEDWHNLQHARREVDGWVDDEV